MPDVLLYLLNPLIRDGRRRNDERSSRSNRLFQCPAVWAVVVSSVRICDIILDAFCVLKEPAFDALHSVLVVVLGVHLAAADALQVVGLVHLGVEKRAVVLPPGPKTRNSNVLSKQLQCVVGLLSVRG